MRRRQKCTALRVVGCTALPSVQALATSAPCLPEAGSASRESSRPRPSDADQAGAFSTRPSADSRGGRVPQEATCQSPLEWLQRPRDRLSCAVGCAIPQAARLPWAENATSQNGGQLSEIVGLTSLRAGLRSAPGSLRSSKVPTTAGIQQAVLGSHPLRRAGRLLRGQAPCRTTPLRIPADRTKPPDRAGRSAAQKRGDRSPAGQGGPRATAHGERPGWLRASNVPFCHLYSFEPTD